MYWHALRSILFAHAGLQVIDIELISLVLVNWITKTQDVCNIEHMEINHLLGDCYGKSVSVRI